MIGGQLFSSSTLHIGTEPVKKMTYDEAIKAVWAGKEVCREGWKGHGTVFQGLPKVAIRRSIYTGCSPYEFLTNTVDAAEHYHCYYSGPVMCLKAENGIIYVGWEPSKDDEKANDWIEV